MFSEIMKEKSLVNLVNFFASKIAEKYWKTYTYEDAQQELLLHVFEVYQKKQNALTGSIVKYLKGSVRNRAFDFLNEKRSYGKKVTRHQSAVCYDTEVHVGSVKCLRTFTDNEGLQSFLTREDADRAYKVVIKKFQVCDTVTHQRAADILKMLTTGYKQSEIAAKMKVSPNLITKISRKVIIPELKREFCYG